MPLLVDDRLIEPNSASDTASIRPAVEAHDQLPLRAGISVLSGDASQKGSSFRVTRHIPQSLFNEYRSEAFKQAQIRQLSDQSWYAEIPAFPGVWASEKNPLSCLTVLDEVLTDWLLLKIEHQDRDIPIVSEIDLNPIA